MECKHDYEVLENDTTIEEIRYFDSNEEAEINISGYVVFYCRKCLDVQKKVF